MNIRIGQVWLNNCDQHIKIIGYDENACLHVGETLTGCPRFYDGNGIGAEDALVTLIWASDSPTVHLHNPAPAFDAFPPTTVHLRGLDEKDLDAPLVTGSAADILDHMAETFRERNKVYGSNYKMVGPMMKVLFPDGVPKDVVHSDQFHLFELMLVKLSRFAISGLKHQDSIHDAGVYAAMIEHITQEVA
jgi:hypothetical protein